MLQITRGGNTGISVGEDGAFMIDDHFFQTTDKISAALADITHRPVDFIDHGNGGSLDGMIDGLW